MSNFPSRSQPRRRGGGRTRSTLRAAFVLAAVTAVISSTPAIAGLEVNEPATAVAPDTQQPQGQVLANAPAVSLGQLTRVEVDSPPRDCNPLFADACVPLQSPVPEPVSVVAPSCSLPGPHGPTSDLDVVSGGTGDPNAGDALRVRVEVENGLAIDAPCFAATVVSVLSDPRGWTTVDGFEFARVDDETYDFRLVLASPDTTDSLCYPARTAGDYSCRNGETVIINVMRWESGTDDYIDDLATYRSYLLNHEVGHLLGRGHASCRAAGELAPVMMQQTKGLGECLPNGWPTEDER